MKKYIGIDVGNKGFIAVIDNGEYRFSEHQREGIENVCHKFGKLSKEMQSYFVDKLLSSAKALLNDYDNKTASPICQTPNGSVIPTDKEIWKDIVVGGVENCYQVSNFGRVRHINKNIDKGGRILKIKENPKVGYIYLTIKIRGKAKHFRVHRLVAEAFIPNPNGYTEVNHIDENKLNNRAENLEWCSRVDNARYGTKQDRMLNTRRLRDLPNKGISIVGIDPQTNEIRVRFESLREAHCNGYDRVAIATRIKHDSKTLYKGLIWQKNG